MLGEGTSNTTMNTAENSTTSPTGPLPTDPVNFEGTLITFSDNPTITIRLEEAIRLIPNCSGENDYNQFINACDLAVHSVDKNNVPFLIRYITTKLSGKAFEVIKYKNVSKWMLIKKYLKEAFESQYSASFLQLQINSVKMFQGETVNSYTDRVEQLYFKLCNIYSSNKTATESKILQNHLKEQTLALYIIGLIKPLKVMVKARNPKTLEEAKNIASTGEAFKSIKHKNKYKWMHTEKYSEEAFESQYSASSLQLQINSVNMFQGETVNSYTDRVEQLFFKLCNIYTSNKTATESKILQNHLKEQTLALYIKGLIKPFKVMVKARNPKTLEEAKSIARTEELELNAEKETQNLFNPNKRYNNLPTTSDNTNNYQRPNNFNNINFIQPNQNRNNNNDTRNNYQRTNYANDGNFNNKNIECYKCNGPHFPNQCRSNQVQRSNYRVPNNNNNTYSNNRPSNNNNNSNNFRPNNNNYNNNYRNNGFRSNDFTRPPTNYNTQSITCNYCYKRGHDIADNEHNNSGNDRTDASRGPHTVYQIQTAEEMLEWLDDVST